MNKKMETHDTSIQSKATTVLSIVPSTIRTIVGPTAQVFLFSDFVRIFAPNLQCNVTSSRSDNDHDDVVADDDHDALKTTGNKKRRRYQDSVINRIMGTLVSPNVNLQPMSDLQHVVTAMEESSLSTLVDDVVWSLVNNNNNNNNNRSNKRPQRRRRRGVQNVLSRGYVAASPQLEQSGVTPCQHMRPGVMCQKLNGNVTFCKTSRYFRTLHKLVGDDLVRILLRRTSMFVPLPTIIMDAHNTITTKDSQHKRNFENYMMICGPYPTPTRKLIPASKPDQAHRPPITTTTTTTTTTTNMIHESFNQNKRKRRSNSSRSTKRKRKCKILKFVADEDSTKDPFECNTTTSSSSLGPNDTINRRSMFYSESYIPKIGFSRNHILNRTRYDGGHDQQKAEKMKVVLLLSHMIPLFRHNNNDNNNNNIVGKRKYRKRWQRLRETGINMCHDILKRHARCDYHRLLEKHCTLSNLVLKAKNNLMKRPRKRKFHQEPSTEPKPSFLSSSSPQEDAEVVTLAQVSAAYTPPQNVVAFLASVLQTIFPHSFWGSFHNFEKVLDVVDIFVKLRRNEDLPNKTIMKGIRITDFDWLMGINQNHRNDGKRTTNSSRSNHQATAQLATHVLRWLFSCFIVPLLRSNFFITESEFSGKRVLYYRKPVWSLLRSLSMNHLLSQQYTEIMTRAAVQTRLVNQRMGCSRLRLLPKRTGVRPIATLCKRDVSANFDAGVGNDPGSAQPDLKRRRLNHGGSQANLSSSVGGAHSFQSTNDILRDTFEALKYEHGRNKDLFGAGILGLHEFHSRFRNFVSAIKSKAGISAPKLYFASVDVRHCYDNIDQDRLLEIVVELLTENDYMISRYAKWQSSLSMDCILKKKKSDVGPPTALNVQDKIKASNAAKTGGGSVFVDEAGSTLTSKDKIIALLREHLKSHLVVTKGRHGDRYLLQTKGIPQGSVLSGFLCNFYYGNMEKELFGNSVQRGRSMNDRAHLLVRIIDDFLLITTDQALQKTFLQTMYKGKPSIGLSINKDKIVSNANVTVEDDDGACYAIRDTMADTNGFFPWCGMLLDTRNCEVMIDYSRITGGKATDSLTVLRSASAGEHFRKLMKVFVRPRCLPILFDPFFATPVTAETNFFDLCLLCAVKTIDILITSDMATTAAENSGFLLSSIEDVILFALHLIQNHLKQEGDSLEANSPLVQPKSKLHIQRRLALSLGWNAFYKAFQQSKALATVLDCVEKTIKRSFGRPRVPKRVAERSQMKLILDSAVMTYI